MIVVIANALPPAVRGRMKLWFVEPRPNIFVSGVKDSVAEGVLEYIFKFCPFDSGLLIFQKIKESPGYKIRGMGSTDRVLVDFDGMQLVSQVGPGDKGLDMG